MLLLSTIDSPKLSLPPLPHKSPCHGWWKTPWQTHRLVLLHSQLPACSASLCAHAAVPTFKQKYRQRCNCDQGMARWKQTYLYILTILNIWYTVYSLLLILYLFLFHLSFLYCLLPALRLCVAIILIILYTLIISEFPCYWLFGLMLMEGKNRIFKFNAHSGVTCSWTAYMDIICMTLGPLLMSRDQVNKLKTTEIIKIKFL